MGKDQESEGGRNPPSPSIVHSLDLPLRQDPQFGFQEVDTTGGEGRGWGTKGKSLVIQMAHF